MRFDRICEANDIQHRPTKALPSKAEGPNHPWTNGQVEQMNRTIKEATVKRFHYESHEQLQVRPADFRAAYNFARRLKTLSGFMPYEYIAKIWTSEPDRFIADPVHQMPRLNTWWRNCSACGTGERADRRAIFVQAVVRGRLYNDRQEVTHWATSPPAKAAVPVKEPCRQPYE